MDLRCASRVPGASGATDSGWGGRRTTRSAGSAGHVDLREQRVRVVDVQHHPVAREARPCFLREHLRPFGIARLAPLEVHPRAPVAIPGGKDHDPERAELIRVVEVALGGLPVAAGGGGDACAGVRQQPPPHPTSILGR